ncbi:MAG: M14 family zinc carboxypeptidase [Lachnospiraceae bacterium]|nr:M14 family zinc carboxypeptidase [Lachnospiraceae bacterium]
MRKYIISSCLFFLIFLTVVGCRQYEKTAGTVIEEERSENIISDMGGIESDSGGESTEPEIENSYESTEAILASSDFTITEGDFYTANVNEFLSLRIFNNTEAFCIKKLQKNSMMKVLQFDGTFSRVVTEEGLRGYVMSSYLKKSTDSFEEKAVSEGNYTVICQEFLSLRQSASSLSAGMEKLTPGTQVVVKSISGAFANIEVCATNQTGFVLSEYLSEGFYDGAEEDKNYKTELKVVQPISKYSYDQMVADLENLESMHAQIMVVKSIGNTEEGRSIPVVVVGNQSSSKQILIHGSIHAREYGTTRLIMSQLDYMLNHQQKEYQGSTISSILNDVCFHIIPMVNPDGVMISQSETLPVGLDSIYESDKNAGHTTLSEANYAKRWKANGKGVDLNRNFDAGWSAFAGRDLPSSEKYKGTEQESTKEAKALADYTRRHNLKATVSYHESGSIIYYNYGSDAAVNELSKSMALKIKEETNYPLVKSTGVDAAGYKDWAIDVQKIPSVTIETGVGTAPVGFEEFVDIYRKNRDVLLAVSQWIN